ncbi:CD3337/EF1877 family mobilome membrane protein [Oceanobacillus polygoni]|uniref:TrbL/VirB6 plasmid conjugal transfer protein n=1 Tax=Oceanobacillus polygoni TaxID=1235259 RepID=A0A9X0Z1U2_9BACI|nr:hypothetical protein [Oceanobacillus polygoni]MBP2079651.1 hypothetical protein [Oceanobacillus polygoni]
MKNNKRLVIFLTIILLCMGLSSTVYAEEEEVDESGRWSDLYNVEDTTSALVLDFLLEAFGDKEYKPYPHMTEPADEKVGGVTLEIERYPVERYMVNNQDVNGTFGVSLHGINNFLMGINQKIVTATDSAMGNLFLMNFVDDFADDIERITDDIFDTLKDYFAELLFSFLCVYLIFLFLAKGNARESFRKFGLFVIVLAIAGYWLSNASFLMKSMNALSGEMQGHLVEAGNSIIDILEDKRSGVYSGIDDIEEDEKLEGTISVIRNVYFDLAMKRPYLLINYGQTDENLINDKDDIKEIGFGFQEFSRTDRMLAFKLSADGSAYRISHANTEVAYGNENMASGSSFAQSGLVFLMFIIVVGLSIPMVLISVLNFGLQIMAIVIALVLPFAFIISFLPQFVMSGLKALGKLFTTFLLKALIGIFLFIIYLLTYTMYVFVNPDEEGMYLLHAFLLIILFFWIIWKRNSIISFVTAGRVQSVDGNIMGNMNQYYSKQFDKAKGRMQRNRVLKRFSPMAKENSNNKQERKSQNPTNKKEDRQSNVVVGNEKNRSRTSQKRNENDKESVNNPTPLKTENPTRKRRNQRKEGKEDESSKESMKGKETGRGTDNEIERNKQEDSFEDREIENVSKENRGNWEVNRGTDNEIERNKQEDSFEDREVENVSKENRSDWEANPRTDNEIERNKQENSSEDREVENVSKENRNDREVNHGTDYEVTREKQENIKDDRQVEDVKKENRNYSRTGYDTEQEVQRNRNTDFMDDRNVNQINQENKIHLERVQNEERNRNVSSVEERKKERDET